MGTKAFFEPYRLRKRAEPPDGDRLGGPAVLGIPARDVIRLGPWRDGKLLEPLINGNGRRRRLDDERWQADERWRLCSCRSGKRLDPSNRRQEQSRQRS